MPKFNTRDNRATRTATGPLTVGRAQLGPGGVLTPETNAQGGHGYTRDAKSDLYLIATTSQDITADAFYEGGSDRVNRFVALVAQTAVADPGWTYQFLTWLRTQGNIRTAAVVGGIEAARALTEAGIPGGRYMVSTVLRRPDEPGEAIAYHHARHGRKLPMSVKRGVADAAARLYSERAVLKYDTASHGVRFADVLALTHAKPSGGTDDPWGHAVGWQADLFGHIIDRRYGREADLSGLPMITQNATLRARWTNTVGPGLAAEVTADRLRDAGMTWEDALSALGSKVDKAALWRALIPSMGFMARLRNLRNFDQAGLADKDLLDVIAMLTDPDRVAASKQLPLRFLSAHRATEGSLRWAYPLSRALDASLANVPALPGRTLILVDTSGSMADTMSDRSGLKRWDAASSFGIALAKRAANVDLISYSGGGWGYSNPRDHTRAFLLQPGAALLAEISRWENTGYNIGGGTDTVGAIRRHFNGHDRVVLLTDEEDGGYRGTGVTDALPATTPLYTFNLAGYRHSHAPTGPYRITLGGLTDAMFGLIPQIEAGTDGWPWEGDNTIGELPNYAQTVGAMARKAAGL